MRITTATENSRLGVHTTTITVGNAVVTLHVTTDGLTVGVDTEKKTKMATLDWKWDDFIYADETTPCTHCGEADRSQGSHGKGRCVGLW